MMTRIDENGTGRETQAIEHSNAHNCTAPNGKIQVPMFAELGVAPTSDELSPDPVEPVCQFDPLSWEWVSVDEACRLFGLSRIALYRLMQITSDWPAATTPDDQKPPSA